MKAWEFKRSPLVISSDDSPVINITEFTFDSAKSFAEKLSELESDQSSDSVFINVFSYGGEADPLLAMVDMVRYSSKDIYITGLGLVCSAGAYFLALGPKGNRWMSENCLMHIHHTSSDMAGDAKTLKRELDALEITDKKIFSMMASNSKLSASEIFSEIREHEGEWFFGAEEALEYGLIDHIGIPKLNRYEVWECEVTE